MESLPWNVRWLQRVIRLLLRVLFRFRAYNTEVLQTPGPVLLTPNHLTWIDWLFLIAHVDHRWRFVTSRTTAQTSPLHRWIMINRFTFPIDTASPYAVKQMAEHLMQGGRLVLFPEGRMSRTGAMMKLYEGTGFLLFKTRARVIPCYLRGAERIRWAKHKGWKRWLAPVSVHYGQPLEPPQYPGLSTTAARLRLTRWLRDVMLEQQLAVEQAFGPPTVTAALLRMAAARPGFRVLEDFTGQKLTYRRLVVGAELLAEVWRAQWPEETQRIGVLLPNANALPVTLLSLWLTGKVPALLNYTTGPAVMRACAQLAGLRHIITSRAFITRARLRVEPLQEAGLELIYLEDVRQRISSGRRLARMCWRCLKMPRAGAGLADHRDATAVILFTSGSEGVPKGVELTHGNLMANIRQLFTAVPFQDDDRFFNALPLFHSFGLTAGTLAPLTRGLGLFLYPSPLHYRLVPEVFYDRACTVLLGTNTFLNGYARRAHPYDFYQLRYIFAGAEKVQESTAQTYARKFGARILEGYGATECSPVIAVNSPLEPRFGTAGRLLPGMEYRVEPVEGVPQGGRLLVRGPNVMKGYLNPEANAAFQALGGWYDTGDIAHVDEDRYVTLLGRLKRFAKISGEMVSLTAVEEALAGAFPQYGQRCTVAVLSQPDADKGERLVAVANDARLTVDDLRQALLLRGLPALCVPREVVYLRELPLLGTGKVNYRELQSWLAARKQGG
ncbi:AMP-binding protein [Fontisphaera persica]|uniref:AMP-binding protein n=1 Tax=Fontisphaera persica TaxID=2974023 RepID=UPI0024BF736C|nr:AMP-binding protein [Fontisphaera persica]WCJ58195.1 AMP-binding protein [Fontisphaera persica]